MDSENVNIEDTKEFLVSLIDDLILGIAKFNDDESTRIMPFGEKGRPICGKAVNLFDYQRNTENSLKPNDEHLKPADCFRRPHEDWLIDAIGNENSDEDIVLFERKAKFFVFDLANKRCQTDSSKLKRLTFDESKQMELAAAALPPCEMTKQIVLIEALSYPTPSVLSRAPLMDRFCYMLTDFASALYLSIAIMCCCTPSMFVRR